MAVLWQRRHRPSVPSICWAKSKTLGEAQPGRAPGRQLQCCRSVCSIPLPYADAWTQTSGTGLAWEHGDSKVLGHGRASSSCLCMHEDSCRAMLCGTACAWRGPGWDMCEWGARCAGTEAGGPARGVCLCAHSRGGCSAGEPPWAVGVHRHAVLCTRVCVRVCAPTPCRWVSVCVWGAVLSCGVCVCARTRLCSAGVHTCG